MADTGQWSRAQLMGRSWPIGCVALEITQRCNLDCTLCYLSESSQALKDLPLEEVFRRIDNIRARFGGETNVQITGGEPTLRTRAELLAVVRRCVDAGLRPALFTNGVHATRGLLAELCDVGLSEVAFHVDTTQQRKGYASEAALHALRDQYIERARGLPLAVYFNTTVHDGNFAEMPDLVRFFIRRAGAVCVASFQLQAETGRGIMGRRSDAISLDSMTKTIQAAAGVDLDFEAVRVGHARCNRYSVGVVANGRLYDALDDRGFVSRFIAETATLRLDRVRWSRSLPVLLLRGLRRPAFLVDSAAWLARKAWRMRRDLVAGRGRVRKLSFFIHNFMDARSLEQERIDACVFATATSAGPVSMCLHNACRDDDLLKPVPVRIGFWNPISGAIESEPARRLVVRHSRKTARGRARARLGALPAAPMPQGHPAEENQRGKHEPSPDRHVEHVLLEHSQQDGERENAEARCP
jgi:molybdenum cofactor biosynthesis enzyme MoaA